MNKKLISLLEIHCRLNLVHFNSDESNAASSFLISSFSQTDIET